MSGLRQTIRQHGRRLSGIIRRFGQRFWGFNKHSKPSTSVAVRNPRKSSKQERERNNPWIPTNVLLQIFARLPFRDIARLRVLSKPWYASLNSVYLFEVLLQQNKIDFSRCIVALCGRPSKTRIDRYTFKSLSLQLFFPPLQTWFQLPLHPALISKLPYGLIGLGRVHLSKQKRYIPAAVWGCHSARGLMCSLISLDNKYDQSFSIRARNHRIVVFNYLTGKSIASISLPLECILHITSDFICKILPDPSCSEDYTVILSFIDYSSSRGRYTCIYNSKLGSWRPGRYINSAVDVNTESECFENADVLNVVAMFIEAYSLKYDKWYTSNLGIWDIWSHVFTWRGKVYLADALVNFDYRSDTLPIDSPVAEVNGFRVSQLRTRTSGHGLYWHEISSTPAECLEDLQNVKGKQKLIHISFEDNGCLICMAGFNNPETIDSPSNKDVDQPFYVWTPILYDLEYETWSLLPHPKNDH